MNEEKLHKAAKLGDQAQSMIGGGQLEPMAFNAAAEMLREELMKAWMKSKSTEDRDRIWISVNLLEKLADSLGSIAANGRVAKSDLDRLLKK